MKKSIKILIVIGILVILIAGGFFAWQKEWLSKIPFLQKNEMADWKTYQNIEWGFEFKIAPIFLEKGYKVVVEDKKALSEEYPGQTIDHLARIAFETRPVAPHYASVSKEEYQGMFFILIYPQSYCSDKGKEFCNQVRKGDALFANYLAENKTYFLYYNIGGTSGGDMWDAMGWNKDEVKQNFNQMLSTFKFLEIEGTALEVVFPQKGEVWKIGETNKIRLNKPVPESNYFQHVILEKPDQTEIGIIKCKVGAVPSVGFRVSEIDWDTKTVLHYCGAGLKGKLGEIEPGIYKIAVVQDGNGSPILAESESFSIIDGTKDWMIYKNLEYGFEIRYPKNLTKEEAEIAVGDTISLVSWDFPLSASYVSKGIEINITDNPQSKSLRSILFTDTDYCTVKKEESAFIKIDCDWSNTRSIYSAFAENNKVYTISFSVSGLSNVSNENIENELKIYNQMVSTLLIE